MAVIMLQYGVVAGGRLKAWELECVRNIEMRRLARLRCAIACAAPAPPAAAPYERLCAATVASSQRVVAPDELARRSDEFITLDSDDSGAEWQRHLRDLALDFILVFGDVELGDAAQSARYGVWRFVYGDPARFRAAVPGFWEMYAGHDVTSAALVRTSAGAETVLKCGHLGTVKASFSRNVDAICKAMAAWPSMVCANGVEDTAAEAAGSAAVQPRVRYGWPTALETALLSSSEAGARTFEYLRSRLFSVDWNVGIVRESPSDFIGRNARPKPRYLFPAKTHTYLADPCVVRLGARTMLFCEQFDHRHNRGILVSSEFACNRAAEPTVAIEEPHHLSYPHVFELNGALYCIPESGHANKICLYRANESVDRWHYVRTLVDNFAGVDSTVVRHDGKWWLFCTSAEAVERGFNSHLYVWYSDDLFGTWKPHALNPVKIDARSARCAGAFFTHEGALYRPVQDCAASYGAMIHIERIEKLTEREFEETTVGTIRPPGGRYRSGIHTISAAGDVCVVDAKRYVFSPWRIGFALRRLGRRTARAVTGIALSGEEFGPLR
ncbi:MAG TPA: hypothetical protein VGG89_01910 [Candidatus Baltobacteraceae bacterium]|jgi:hypothetical protein